MTTTTNNTKTRRTIRCAAIAAATLVFELIGAAHAETTGLQIVPSAPVASTSAIPDPETSNLPTYTPANPTLPSATHWVYYPPPPPPPPAGLPVINQFGIVQLVGFDELEVGDDGRPTHYENPGDGDIFVPVNPSVTGKPQPW